VQPSIIGWDIGGAHVKVAVANKQIITQVHQLSCPLWKGVNELASCIDNLSKDYIKHIDQYSHAITMTGELVDHFDNRKQGVIEIVDEISKKLNTSDEQGNIKYYAGNEGFVNTEQVIEHYKQIASANWLASVSYAASKLSNALFIDIGSTTTDIVEIRDHKAAHIGYTDEQRLIAKELVYCGVVRTPVFAIIKSAQIKGQQIPVINEYFSNAADVYRLTEELPEYADLGETSDGRNKDAISSAMRLARMFANDAKQSELDTWREVARQIRSAQLQLIKDACRHQLMKKNLSLNTPIIAAGVGRFLVKDLASQLGRDYIDFDELFEARSHSNGFSIGDCAPAASVACLAINSMSKKSAKKIAKKSSGKIVNE